MQEPEITPDFDSVYSLISNQEYNRALSVLQRMPPNQTVLLVMSNCHEHLGDRNTAIDCLKRIVPQDNFVLGILAKSYTRFSDTEKALSTYESIPNKDDNTLYAYASLLKTTLQYQKAVDVLVSITNVNDIVLNLLAQCYQLQGDHKNAVENYKKISSLTYDQLCLLAQAYRNLGEVQKSKDFMLLASLKDNLDKNPASAKTHYAYGRGLIFYWPEKCVEFATICLKKFSHHVEIWHLYVEALIETGRHPLAVIILAEALRLFPDDFLLHINLLKHYLFLGAADRAQELFTYCYHLFAHRDDLCQKLPGLLRSAHFISQDHNTYSYSTLTLNQTAFPKLFQTVFSLIDRLTEEKYICGNAVLNALEGKPFNSEDEIEILTFINNQSFHEVTNQFLQRAFRNSAESQYRFKRKLPSGLSIICYAILPPVNFIFNLTTFGLFTICSLYMDKYGNIFDPSGRGSDDLRNKILRPMGNADEILRYKPISVIYAISYIVQGYRPSAELEKALHNWDIRAELDLYRIHSLVQRQLALPTARKFVNALDHYGLLNKLFLIKSSHIPEENLQLLKLVVKQKIPKTVEKPFWQPTQSSVLWERRQKHLANKAAVEQEQSGEIEQEQSGEIEKPSGP